MVILGSSEVYCYVRSSSPWTSIKLTPSRIGRRTCWSLSSLTTFSLNPRIYFTVFMCVSIPLLHHAVPLKMTLSTTINDLLCTSFLSRRISMYVEYLSNSVLFLEVDIEARGARPNDAVLLPKQLSISAPRTPRKIFAATQDYPKDFHLFSLDVVFFVSFMEKQNPGFNH